MRSKAKKIYRKVLNKVQFVPGLRQNKIFKILFNNKNSKLKTSNYLSVLDKFNSLINSKINDINVFDILNELIIQDLQNSFVALSLQNKEGTTVDINYSSLNKAFKCYTVIKELENNCILKVFDSNKSLIVSKNINEEFNFDLGSDVKQLINIPIAFNEKIYAVLSVGSKTIDKNQELILSLIAQQLSFIFINNDLKGKLKKSLSVDQLTSFNTHSCFQQRLNFELKKAKNINTPLSIMIIDVNKIRIINESFGHLIGDRVIYFIADILKKNLRDMDIAARFSGNKFAVILLDTDSNAADIVAKRFVKDLSRSSFIYLDNITVSIGISTYPDNSESKDLLLYNADNALTIAKKESIAFDKSTIINTFEIKNLDSIAQKSNEVLLNVHNINYENDITDKLISNLHLADQMQYSFHILLEIVSSLAAAIDAKDTYTRGHSQAVARYSEIICQHLNLSREETEKIKLGALMHDIGKIGIPEKLLAKPGKLNDKEWEIMKQHPTIGARRIIQPISALKNIIPVVEHHHERYDGLGYPHKLKNQEIPIGARIVSVADAFNTMTTDRPYRKSLGYDKAIKILDQGSGAQWDGSIIKSFLEISRKAYNQIQNNSF